MGTKAGRTKEGYVHTNIHIYRKTQKFEGVSRRTFGWLFLSLMIKCLPLAC